MAKKTLIIDDLTGDTGAQTRALRFDGIDYEIDLTDASYAELRRVLKPYLKAARPTGGRAASVRPAATRIWLSHSYLNEEGRLPWKRGHQIF